MRLFTIGHSTLAQAEFIRVLAGHGIERVADIRALPGSRRYPWFAKAEMAGWLGARGVGYFHLPELGGRRPRQKGVDPGMNAWWANASFHNYADYTQGEAYEGGIAELLGLAQGGRLAFMCSEAVPWRCHRLLVSNTLVARGHEVIHIVGPGVAEAHALGRWGAAAQMRDGRVVYPAR